ncbi:MAG: haloalkane dehalogenase [Candidatus Azotimanducaceae bacterium]|jgi:haloalkane dehalogenase
MEFVRTDDSRFQDLPDYPFQPNYVNVDDLEGGQLRMHYIDEGQGEVILCIHGQPSWSYLYRKMIPIFVSAGYRVIAPDLIGFGKSDKPTQRENYTYANHVAWVKGLVESLDLTNITLVCQDWGGLIGLRVAAENEARFARLVPANTGLPDAEGVSDDKIEEMSGNMRAYFDSLAVPANVVEMATAMMGDTTGMGFLHWVKYCGESEGFSPQAVLTAMTGGVLSEAEQKAYGAPFPDESYHAGGRQFPSLVPIMPDNPAIPANRVAWAILKQWQKPLLTAFSDSDPVTAGGDVRFQNSVPGAQGQPHITIKGAGHFLQEQAPEELAAATIKLIQDNPV